MAAAASVGAGAPLSILLAAGLCGALTAAFVATLMHSRNAARTHTYVIELQEAQLRLQHHLTHDVTTGLLNRAAFETRVREALTQARRDDSILAVAMLDIDRFKTFNDSLGRAAGDRLLGELAQRLRAIDPARLSFARLGADEFALLIPQVRERREIERITSAVLAASSGAITLGGVELYTALSIGVSIYPADGRTVDDLLARAEAAMRAAQERGGNVVEFYPCEVGVATQERLTLEADLRRAIVRDELEVHYQPQFSLSNGSITCVEALVRWRHPTRGMLAPGMFIPLAEETGLIVPIGEWVLREACRQARAWRFDQRPPVRMAVNLSPLQFRQKDLLGAVLAALEAAQLPPECLELELTESSVMMNHEQSVLVLEELRTVGVRVSIDDFGTGYSSLSQLRRLPIEKLKIDRCFVRDLSSSRMDQSIVRAMCELTHGVGLQVVAEGIETAEQYSALRSLGCEHGQGYYLCAPQPPAALEDLLQSRREQVEVAVEFDPGRESVAG